MEGNRVAPSDAVGSKARDTVAIVTGLACWRVSGFLHRHCGRGVGLVPASAKNWGALIWSCSSV
jgi:hypothetical protein